MGLGTVPVAEARSDNGVQVAGSSEDGAGGLSHELAVTGSGSEGTPPVTVAVAAADAVDGTVDGPDAALVCAIETVTGHVSPTYAAVSGNGSATPMHGLADAAAAGCKQVVDLEVPGDRQGSEREQSLAVRAAGEPDEADTGEVVEFTTTVEEKEHDKEHRLRRSTRTHGVSTIFWRGQSLQSSGVVNLLNRIRQDDPELAVLRIHNLIGTGVNTVVIDALRRRW